MRRIVVGVLGLVLCSTAQAESWNGTLWRFKTKGIGTNYEWIKVKNLGPRARGWKCNRKSFGQTCMHFRQVDDNLELRFACSLRRTRASWCMILGFYNGEYLGSDEYVGRLKYRP